MCKYINAIDTNTKFIILMHPKEFKKVKNNTGFFTYLSLKNSELFIGIDFSNDRRINEIIQTHTSYILFPSADAINLCEIDAKINIRTIKPMAIFIIDSTWACTKKIFTLSQNLNKLQHISFTSKKTSEYKIKEQPDKAYLSTIESTLVVLELLNANGIENVDESRLNAFLKPFYKMIEYQEGLINNPRSNAVRFKKGRQG